MNTPIRILYVDDYPLDRDLVRDALVVETSGIHLSEASSRDEFLAQFEKGKYDLILSDFNIAGFDALQVLEVVADRDPDLPVVIVTGTGSEEAAVAAMKRGAADYVIKTPHHIRRLARTIFAVLDQKRMELERRRAEEALRESEERFKSIFENVAIGLYRATPEGKLMMGNPALVQMLGFSSFMELFQRNLEELGFTPLYRRPDFQEQMIREGVVVGEESAWVRRDGSSLYVRESARAVVDQGGAILCYEGTVEDITERKLTEAALEENERRFREAYEQTQMALAETSALYRISRTVTANESLKNTLQTVADIVAEALLADSVTLTTLDFEKKQVVDIIRSGSHADGTEAPDWSELMAGLTGWVITNLKPAISSGDLTRPHEQFDEQHLAAATTGPLLVVPVIYQDAALGTIAVANRRGRRDFTERDAGLLMAMAGQAAAAIETARLNEETQLRLEEVTLLSRAIALTAAAEDVTTALFELCKELGRFFAVDRVGFALLNEDRTLAHVVADYCAPGVSSSLGILIPVAGNPSMNYLMEQKGPLVVADAQSDPVMGPVRDVMRQQSVASIVLIPIPIGNEVVGTIGLDSLQPRQFLLEEVALLEHLANQVGLALERIQLLEETQKHAASLQQINEELQTALHAKEQMIQSVSHELRTPLTLIMGYLELLSGGLLGPLTVEQEQALQTLAGQSDQLLVMVNRLLTLQTLDRNSLDKVNLALPAYLEQAQRNWLSTAVQAGLRLRLRVPEDMPPLVADPFFINQVMDNLLENAIKFSPDGGVIEIGVRVRESDVVVSVADQGIGIDPAQARYLFEQFYQGESGTARRFGGMGIGLALCRAIIEAHAGEIWAESAGKGQGSTFYFSLPR